MPRIGLVELAPAFGRQPVTQADIRVRAYFKWEAAGKPESDPSAFWLEAEQELLARSVAILSAQPA